MNLEAVEQDIIRQITNANGIVVLLRERRFDGAKYQPLRDSIIKYGELIKDETMINKQVAGCLWTLESALVDAVVVFNREHIRTVEAESIGKAHAEIWDLLNDIFSMNNLMIEE